MTIANETYRNQYTGDGSNKAFVYAFRVQDKSELMVFRGSATGAGQLLAVDVDYIISGVGETTGGSIALTGTAPESTETITIIRGVPYTQETNFSDEAVNNANNKSVMLAQRNAERLDRHLGIKPNTNDSIGFGGDINIVGGEGKYLRLNTAGNGFELADGTVTPSTDGLGSVAGVSNNGGDVALTSSDSSIIITPNNATDVIDLTANAPTTLDELTDVLAGSPTTGDVLKWTGSNWQALNPSGDILYASDFGVVADGITDDTVAMTAAITATLAKTRGGVLVLPAGIVRITSELSVTIAVKTKSFIVSGMGREVTTLLCDGAFHGFDFSFIASGGWEGDKNTLTVIDMTIETTNAGTYAGVRFEETSGATSPAPSVRVENVVFCGSTTSKYWGFGVDMVDCTFATVNNVSFQGESNSLATVAGVGVRIRGNGDPVDVYINQLRVWNANIGVRVSDTAEGVYISQSTMILTNIGIVWNTTAVEPLLTVDGCHIAAMQTCILGTNLVQPMICNNLFYQQAGLADNWIGIQLDGTTTPAESYGGHIVSNRFEWMTGAGTKNAIVMAQHGYNVIALNRIQNMDTGIWLQSSSKNNVVLDNYITATTTVVLDQGTANTIREVGSSSTSAHRGALVHRNGETDVAISSSTAVKIPFAYEDYDTDGIWNVGAPTRLTVPTGVTKIRMTAQILWEGTGNGETRTTVAKNGAMAYIGMPRTRDTSTTSAISVQNIISPILTVIAGDYFELDAWQTKGSIDVISSPQTWLAMEIIQ
jgi:hypothetical protein